VATLDQPGRIFILVGCVLVVVGVLLTVGDRLPFRLGRLPLDFRIERGDFSLYLPLGTSILISLVLSLIFMWINRR
jgi:uncharacterized protein (DUF3084 family)